MRNIWKNNFAAIFILTMVLLDSDSPVIHLQFHFKSIDKETHSLNQKKKKTTKWSYDVTQLRLLKTFFGAPTQKVTLLICLVTGSKKSISC